MCEMAALRHRFLRLLTFLLALALPAGSPTLLFGVIGDSGSGDGRQLAVARQMESYEKSHPWEFVLMLGDNIYNDGNPRDFDRKFKNVYRNLMAGGVKFHATLGNHDLISPASRKGMAQVRDDAFGYVGHQSEYVLVAGPEVNGKRLARFICLDSEGWLDDLVTGGRVEIRLKRLRQWLQDSGKFHWNFAFFHEPIYSFAAAKTLGRFIGRYGHGPEEVLRRALEPEFEGKIDIVLSGHEHFYQKIRPQKGIHYFISGGGSKIRRGVDKHNKDVEFAAETLHFLAFEVSEGEVKYTAISDRGAQIHSGVIRK